MGSAYRLSVVATKHRLTRATSPSSRTRRATRFSLVTIPSASRSASTRGAPYCWWLLACAA